ncbi:hypothetical protein EP7_005131 [Isosphaeraceae bacterium EP7]
MGTLEVSQRRIDANRRNATLSTGPRTAEGKEQSRRNSLVHGLAGAGVVMPSAESEQIQGRMDRWEASLNLADAFERILVETVAVESVRIDRCRIEERLVRELRGRRATHCWGDERRVEVECVARGLAERPAEVAARLSTSAPGCEWLIERWQSLGRALDKNGGWTEDQASRALDLLGIAPEMRDQATPFNAPDGVNSIEFRQALVDEELERLIGRKEAALDDIEDDLREATVLGLAVVDDRALTLIRRYEAASARRMRWAIDLLREARPAPDHAKEIANPDPSAPCNPAPARAPGRDLSAERTHLADRPVGIHRLADALPPASHDVRSTGTIGRVDIEMTAVTTGKGHKSERNKNRLKALRQSRRRRKAAPVAVAAC